MACTPFSEYDHPSHWRCQSCTTSGTGFCAVCLDQEDYAGTDGGNSGGSCIPGGAWGGAHTAKAERTGARREADRAVRTGRTGGGKHLWENGPIDYRDIDYRDYRDIYIYKYDRERSK